MTFVPQPKNCFLKQLTKVKGRSRWRNADGSRLYEWDGLHGEIEVYNKRGEHLGVLDAVTGEAIKDAVKGRKIDV